MAAGDLPAHQPGRRGRGSAPSGHRPAWGGDAPARDYFVGRLGRAAGGEGSKKSRALDPDWNRGRDRARGAGMKLGTVIGRVTLSVSAKGLAGGRWLIV